MTTVTDLADFLLARIAEDEADAHAAIEWQRGDKTAWVAHGGGLEDGHGMTMAGFVGDGPDVHIARWHPARVLAECDAKRRIVDLHAPYPTADERQRQFTGCALCAETSFIDAYDDEEEGRTLISFIVREEYPCDTLRALALPYADHPDYREEWKP